MLAKGLCQTHYQMQRRGQELRPIKHKPYAVEKCYGPQCERRAIIGRLCSSHYHQLRDREEVKPRAPAPGEDDTCKFEGCEKPAATAGYS